MNRLFGSSSAKPKPNLNDAIASTDLRIDAVEVKVKKLDAELTRFRDQMKKMKDGPGKVSIVPPSPPLRLTCCYSSASYHSVLTSSRYRFKYSRRLRRGRYAC